jgi:hypothetical protein
VEGVGARGMHHEDMTVVTVVDPKPEDVDGVAVEPVGGVVEVGSGTRNGVVDEARPQLRLHFDSELI